MLIQVKNIKNNFSSIIHMTAETLQTLTFLPIK